jgi:hypothetical protein
MKQVVDRKKAIEQEIFGILKQFEESTHYVEITGIEIGRAPRLLSQSHGDMLDIKLKVIVDL